MPRMYNVYQKQTYLRYLRPVTGACDGRVYRVHQHNLYYEVNKALRM